MATIPSTTEKSPVTITKFLGLNTGETGDTQIKTGESGNMDNFYITDDYKLKKMYGYKSFYEFDNDIKGIYGAHLGAVGYLLVATGGSLYYIKQEDLEDEEEFEEITPTLIGSIVDTDCSFFEFNNKVYIISGGYYCWDGTLFQEVTGYIPTVLISCSTNGVGTDYEDINLLTGKKRATYNGDGTSTEYFVPSGELPITSIDEVKVNGVAKTAGTDYTVDLQTGKVTFTSAPSTAMDNVDIQWNRTNSDRTIIEGMKHSTIFGGDTDIRVFLYGSSTHKNSVYYSGLADGVPSVEYFPSYNQAQIGQSNYAVTDLTRQYDRLIATTNKPDAYYLTIGLETLTITLGGGTTVEKSVSSLSVLPLNDAHGNLSFGQGQVLNNYPVTIDNSGFVLWKATNVRDEKNAQVISERIQTDLKKLDMSMFKTIDNQLESQMWFLNGYLVYIYNYMNDTFSRLRIPVDGTHLIQLGKRQYMTLSDNRIVQWYEDYLTYDDEEIKAHWEMNFSDFGAFYLRKTMRKLWVQMQPAMYATADIGYITNVITSPVKKTISYRINTGFDNVNFADFSFQLSVNPQPFRLKLKAKKFTNMKITIDNEVQSGCTILGLAIKEESFGESK